MAEKCTKINAYKQTFTVFTPRCVTETLLIIKIRLLLDINANK